MNQLIDQVLCDRYRVQSLLGRKTGRRSFLALDLQTQLPVVIKLLVFDIDFSWDDLTLFEREAETLKAIDHPAIPKYVDYFEINTEHIRGFALVQSYIEAKSLQEWMEAGHRFKEQQLKDITKQLLKILDYLHSHQPPILHRDIKPSNILLGDILLGDRTRDNFRKVFLVDFGSVQTITHEGTVTVVGTYGYMPPEQFGGRALPASDLYSVGATLIYLATGQHPADLPHQDLRIEFEPFAKLSKSFTRWIQWLTSPSPSQRPASAQEALQRLPSPWRTASPILYLHNHYPLLPTAIQIDASAETFRITVPQMQFQRPLSRTWFFRKFKSAREKSKGEASFAVFTIVFVLCFQLFSPESIVGFFLIVLLSLPLTSIAHVLLSIVMGFLGGFFGVLFAGIKARVLQFLRRPMYVMFYMQDNSIFVSVVQAQSGHSRPMIQSELQDISAGTHPSLQYALNCSYGLGKSFQIVGSRQEIQWLCDELSEWGEVKVRYQDS